MHSFTFVHAADLHLDSPFQGLKVISSEVARVLHEATFKSLERIVDLCLSEKAAFLVLAGDIFDHSSYSLRAWLRLREQLVRLNEQNIATFIAWGNHDYAGGFAADIDWPDLVYFFPPGEVAEIPVLTGNREVARIHGISYPRAQVTENYVRKFKCSSTLFNLGVLHCNVGEQPEHGNYAPCRLETLLDSGFDYWALGHVHRRKILHRERPTVVYPGNSQGRNPRETGEKGCYLVRVKAGHVVDLLFRATDAVRWQVLNVSITGLATEQELLHQLNEHLEALQRSFPGLSILVRIFLTGRGKLHYRIKEENFLDDLLAELREEMANRHPFIWSESVKVQTRPEIQIDDIITRENLPGDFLRLAQEARHNPEVLSTLEEVINPLFNNRRIKQFLLPAAGEQLLEWLEEAKWMGLDYLLGEEE